MMSALNTVMMVFGYGCTLGVIGLAVFFLVTPEDRSSSDKRGGKQQ